MVDELAGDKNDQNKEPALEGLLAQDGVVVLAALAIWGGADAWAAASGLAIASAAAVGNGIVAGWVIASLLHEWGHYAGAKLSGAVAPRVQPKGLSLFRYRFDFEQNNLHQFTAMSIGGSVSHWGLFIALLALLPLSTPGQAAFAGTAFAFAVFASVIEWPIISRTLQGKVQPAAAFGHIDPAFIRRNQVIGGIGGLLFFALV